MKPKIYIGPAGWSYKDWEGIVYPSKKEKGFDQLQFLSQIFNVIEINSSFYRPPAVSTTKSWAERVKSNPDFTFTCKLWQEYTHNREIFPGNAEEILVKQGLDVLQNKNRLGALLIQLPWSFKNTPESLDWLKKVLTLYKDYNPVIEVRHGSWNTQPFLDFLDEYETGFANIDQPVLGQSIPLFSFSSNKLSYLRLHGRNTKNWFAKDATVASRYDYLYNDNELGSMKKKIEDMMENSPKTYIIFNNHYRGQAVANSLQTMFLMDNTKVKAPENLIETYPELKLISKPILETGQTLLF
ncbi:DUF72 domain-containing protein [candidate division KSB1 bacterium]|nr:DUF72 domain-containing protein [candidate division KSB1 bacterium]